MILSINGVWANSCKTESASIASRSVPNLVPPATRYLLISSELSGSMQMAPFSFSLLGSQRYSFSRQHHESERLKLFDKRIDRSNAIRLHRGLDFIKTVQYRK